MHAYFLCVHDKVGDGKTCAYWNHIVHLCIWISPYFLHCLTFCNKLNKIIMVCHHEQVCPVKRLVTIVKIKVIGSTQQTNMFSISSELMNLLEPNMV